MIADPAKAAARLGALGTLGLTVLFLSMFTERWAGGSETAALGCLLLASVWAWMAVRLLIFRAR